VGAVGVVAAAALDAGGAPGVVAVGIVVAIPAALAAVAGAALSIELGPAVNPLEVGPLANAKVAVRSFGPPILAVGGVLPVLGARAAVDAGGSALAGAAPAAVAVVLVSAATTAWLCRSE
jgi:hypothetical protein